MNYKKKIFIVLILLLTMLSICTASFAKYTPAKFKIKDSDTAEVKTIGGQIVGIIQVVGTIFAVGMLIILGIKYILGSAEEKAEYKKSLMPYVIGAILIFGAVNITQVIYDWTVGCEHKYVLQGQPEEGSYGPGGMYKYKYKYKCRLCGEITYKYSPFRVEPLYEYYDTAKEVLEELTQSQQ